VAAAFAIVALASSIALAGHGDCAQPVSSGSGPNASDCSFVLKASVGSTNCTMCVCDVNGTATQTTTDALLCLKKAVGQVVTLNCPPCVTTTTMTGTGASTTSTSTTSTTTTIPVRCADNSACSALPAEFRCNPNTETCEKPCTKNADCKDFYLCNTTTQYCEDAALLF
jgi:hypothetical protein